MSDVSFPPSLTRTPRVSELAESIAPGVVRSEVDVGPAIIRRRFTGEHRFFSIALDLLATELATFDTFFNDTAKKGSLSFEWKNPRTGAVADFRFLSEPRYVPRGPRASSTWWLVTFDVEILPLVDGNTSGGDDDFAPEGGGAFSHDGPFGSVDEVAGDAASPGGESEISSSFFYDPGSIITDPWLDVLFGISTRTEEDSGDSDSDSSSLGAPANDGNLNQHSGSIGQGSGTSVVSF